MRQMLSITRKEFKGYFGSPMALVFMGGFLALTMFFFFWVDKFFARGIADVRPLFHWMPLLMIFLVAALTMRQWSEEQRSGTLEILLTLPVSTVQLVLGKFLAVLLLVAVSLALTVFLPISISLMGPLDWGPVVGGYLAALLLAAAYSAIGLFASSRTDNQIVALFSTVMLCGVLYLVGSTVVTDLVGNVWGEGLRAVGAGSRFESILRGVVDLRDLIYYLSLTGIFLTLNVFSLIAKRWSHSARGRSQRRAITLASALLILNLIAVNAWAYPLHGLRVDLTEQREYSLSHVTRDLLGSLAEPLLIRAYFSEKTHPLLDPLIPTVRDMLREYEIASGGMVQVEIVDPAQDPDKEAEANQVYGIQPTPLQETGRYETSVVNAYFDILILYGDQSVVLNFRDLIEVGYLPDGSVDVQLRNLEYDLTSSIKKVVYGFQSVDAVLAALDEPAKLTLYITPEMLPEGLGLEGVQDTIESVVEDIVGLVSGKLVYEVVDPLAADSPVTPQQLYDQYGLQPYPVSLFGQDFYYLHLLLQVGDDLQLLYPYAGISEAEVRTSIESALKRVSTGFLKVVGFWTPPAYPTQDMFGQVQEPLSSWEQAEDFMRQEYEVRAIDLTTGHVPVDVDVLVVIAPQNMADAERFAVDQYLMRGGSVIVATGYSLALDQYAGDVMLQPQVGGIESLLASYGVTVEQAAVLDPQNEPLSIPVQRRVGDVIVQDVVTVDYPFFVDVRPDGMALDNIIVSTLPAVTLHWVAPVTVDAERNAGRQVTVLLQSTQDSWTQPAYSITPDLELYPEYGFPVSDQRQSYPLAVSIQGVFESAFKDVPAPSIGATGGEGEVSGSAPAVIETSPQTARLIVIGSSEFLDDIVAEHFTSMFADSFSNNLQLLQNAVSWSTEDIDLLSIRARGTSTRLLANMSERDQKFWEGANYVVAILALVFVGIVWGLISRNEQPMLLVSPNGEIEDEVAREEVEK